VLPTRRKPPPKRISWLPPKPLANQLASAVAVFCGRSKNCPYAVPRPSARTLSMIQRSSSRPPCGARLKPVL